MDFLEAVFEAAQAKLFHGRFVQMKSGIFVVEGVDVYFQRKRHDEVTVSIGGEKMDIVKID